MKHNNINLFVLLLILTISYTKLSAQWDFSFSTYQEYNSNPFRSPIAEDDIMSTFSAGLQNNLGDAKVLYFGSYTSFAETSERNSYWHQLGMFVEDSDYVYGVYGEQRINNPEFGFFDYYEITGYYKTIIDFSNISPVLNVSATIKQYNELSEYDNLFISAGFNVNKSYESKTTLLVNGGLNYKYYTNANSGSTLLIDENGESYYQNHMKSSGLTTLQLYSNIRVAQSLFENTGLAVYYTNRTLLNSGVSGSANYNIYFGDESDLYDDPVSRNENSVGLELTQVLPAEFIVKAGFEYGSRIYPSQGIYSNETDYLVDTERTDKQNILKLSASKRFSLSDDNLYKLNIGFNASYYDRGSNSYWYDFKSTGISLNMSLEF